MSSFFEKYLSDVGNASRYGSAIAQATSKAYRGEGVTAPEDINLQYRTAQSQQQTEGLNQILALTKSAAEQGDKSAKNLITVIDQFRLTPSAAAKFVVDADRDLEDGMSLSNFLNYGAKYVASNPGAVEPYSKARPSLTQEIADLRYKISSGASTPEDKLRFESLTAAIAQTQPRFFSDAEGVPYQWQGGVGSSLLPPSAQAPSAPMAQPGMGVQAQGQAESPASPASFNVQGPPMPQAVPSSGPSFVTKSEGIKLQKRAENEVSLEIDKPRAEAVFASLADDVSNINQIIDETMDMANLYTVGMGSTMSFIPGSPAADLAANLETIQADSAFGKLQEIRDNSKTGGALGNVSNVELGLLKSARAALLASQSVEQFKKNLFRYRMVRNRAMKRVAEAFQLTYGHPPRGFEEFLKSEDAPSSGGTQGGNPVYNEGDIATNPNTGESYVRRGGKWYPM